MSPPPARFQAAAGMRNFSRAQRAAGKTIALVPTMGSLHEGHLSLVDAARARADIVVVSIYVNPTQFSQNEDFDKYPRDPEADIAQLTAAGVDAVFEPSSLYIRSEDGQAAAGSDAEAVIGAAGPSPSGHETFVQVERLQQGLCGRSRPHFFRGVATVVAKLFNIVDPDLAFFGRKDYQQWRVLHRMARDLDFAVEVVGVPIVREADGLAMSSRNRLLAEADRLRAPCIYQALNWAQQVTSAGEVQSATSICDEVRKRIVVGGAEVDYVEVVGAVNLHTIAVVGEQPAVLAVAAKYGSVRLIDNIVLEPGRNRKEN